MILKQVIKYDNANAIEATWVDRTVTPQAEVPETPAVLDEEGNIITPSVPAYTPEDVVIETVIKCHSYADVQMDMFRADALELGTPLTEYEEMIALVEANIVPYIPPPPVIPQAVTMRQARLALLGAGVLATVDAAIASMEGIEGDAARIEWEYAHEIRRDSPLVTAMSGLLGLDEAALDQLFLTASTL
jgi:hypothetical protein